MDGDLYALAAAVLDHCKLLLGERAPDRCAVVNTVVWDLEDQLTANVAAIGHVTPREAYQWNEGKMQRLAGPTQVTVVVTLLRCAPELGREGYPDEASLDAASAALLGDVWRLYNGLFQWAHTSGMFGFAPEPLVGMPNPVEEQGGVAGWELSLIAVVNGYDPEV